MFIFFFAACILSGRRVKSRNEHGSDMAFEYFHILSIKGTLKWKCTEAMKTL